MQMECPDSAALLRFCGQEDENIALIETRQNLRILRRGSTLLVTGAD